MRKYIVFIQESVKVVFHLKMFAIGWRSVCRYWIGSVFPTLAALLQNVNDRFNHGLVLTVKHYHTNMRWLQRPIKLKDQMEFAWHQYPLSILLLQSPFKSVPFDCFYCSYPRNNAQSNIRSSFAGNDLVVSTVSVAVYIHSCGLYAVHRLIPVQRQSPELHIRLIAKILKLSRDIQLFRSFGCGRCLLWRCIQLVGDRVV